MFYRAMDTMVFDAVVTSPPYFGSVVLGFPNEDSAKVHCAARDHGWSHWFAKCGRSILSRRRLLHDS